MAGDDFSGSRGWVTYLSEMDSLATYRHVAHVGGFIDFPIGVR